MARTTLGKRRRSYGGFKKRARFSGQPFKLRRPVREDTLKTKVTYLVSLTANASGDTRFVVNADGYYLNSTTLTRFSDTKFNNLGSVYDAYTVTFVKVEFVPSYFPTLSEDVADDPRYITPVLSCLIGDRGNIPLNSFTQTDVSNQSKIMVTPWGVPIKRTINMRYYAENFCAMPYLKAEENPDDRQMYTDDAANKVPGAVIFIDGSTYLDGHTFGVAKVSVYYTFKDRKG